MVNFRNYVSWIFRITTCSSSRDLSCCDAIQIVPSLFYRKFNGRYICVMVRAAIPVRFVPDKVSGSTTTEKINKKCNNNKIVIINHKSNLITFSH